MPIPLPPSAQDDVLQRNSIAGVVPTGKRPARPLAQDATHWLSERTPLVVDQDCCFIDGKALHSVDDWQSVIAHNRLPQVRGGFALAWRSANGGVNLARDAIGERTLYYHAAGAVFAFASDLRALLAMQLFRPSLDARSIARYLSYAYIPGQHTLFNEVNELCAGQQLSWQGGSMQQQRFWQVPDDTLIVQASEQEFAQRLRECLQVAVSRRMPAQGAVAATVSGGIDSSLVAAIACQHAGARLRAYSISFGEGYRNELEHSALLARHCGIEQHIVEVLPAQVMQQLDQVVSCLSKPNGDPLTVPNYLLFKAAAQFSAVVLNGEGGDPCFGGPKNQPMLLSEVFGSDLYAPADALRRERAYLRAHERGYDDLQGMLHADLRASGTPDTVAAKAAQGFELERELTPWLGDTRRASFINRLMATNVVYKGAHHILPKVDALSRAFSVFARSPLFDRDVVQLAFAIPPQLKMHGSREKHILKCAVSDLLPPAIINRPKSGMLVPVQQWFRGPLAGVARERLMDGLREQRIIDPHYLQTLLDFRRPGLHPRTGIKIWLLLTLESWLRQWH